MPLLYPSRRIGPFGLSLGLTSRLLHDRYGADFGVRFHRDVAHRVETVMEVDRAVWRDFKGIGLGYEEPFPRATIEPFGHRFVPVLYGSPGDASARMGYNPHYQPLSCLQNLGSVINTGASVFGDQVLCLSADDHALLRKFYRNVTNLMLLCLREFPRIDGAALAEHARSMGASFPVHQDSGATPHLANYTRIGYVQSLDFGQDTDFSRAAELFPGASASCILFPGWIHSTPIEGIAEELERISPGRTG